MADKTESNGGGTAYADALARARQIAAKLGAGSDDNPLKRPLEGGSDSQPDAKKMATNDHMNAALSSQPSGASRAAQLASQINAKLGVGNAGPAPVAGAPDPGSAFLGVPFGPAQSEVISVPDRMVGLLIGKGGEQIAAIQNETECRVQFAPDSGGMPNRQTTLTGTASAIAKAKETIQRLIAKLQGGPLDSNEDGQTGVIELLVPGGKVGLIIGKGGETIKQLQERAGVKIVVIQDSNSPTQADKPVRITGDRQSCLRAKDMLLDLLAQKDLESGQVNYGGGPGGHSSGGGREIIEIPVPRNLIGVIIGKSGDMINKIQSDSGCRVQFKSNDESTGGPTRICTISGDPHGSQIAQSMILELIDSGSRRQGGMDMGGGGRGRGRGRGMDGFGGDWPPGPGGGGSRFDGTTYVIPADKCGLVIGKGGETIREINRQSGAHCELSRDPPPNPHERVFRIQGSHEQVQSAIRLINEKTGQQQMPDNAFRGPPGPMGGPMGGPPQMAPNPYGPPNPQPMPYQQQMQPPHQQVPQPGQMQQPGMMPQQGAPQPWGAPYQNPYGQMAPAQAPGPDPAKQAADANAAAWAAYYAQMYGQQSVQQQQQQQPQPAQQPQQQPAPVGAYNAPVASAAPAAAQPQPTINPQTGQPDYSAAWAEYYRQQGMHQHAAAIMQAAQQTQGGHPGGQ